MEMGQVLLDAQKAEVLASIVPLGVGVKLKGKSQPRTHKQTAAEDAFKALNQALHLPRDSRGAASADAGAVSR
eukprot:3845984-Prymnesium_polylepis.1